MVPSCRHLLEFLQRPQPWWQRRPSFGALETSENKKANQGETLLSSDSEICVALAGLASLTAQGQKRHEQQEVPLYNEAHWW